jgi:hypothetical protein
MRDAGRHHTRGQAGGTVPDEEVDRSAKVAGVIAIRTRLEAGYRYRDLMQREPDVVLAHAALARALRPESAHGLTA